MMVDKPIPPLTALPSSQPTDDEQIIFHPSSPKGKSAACIDDTLPTAPQKPLTFPPSLQAITDELKCWRKITDCSYFSLLSTDKLRNLSDYGHLKALELNVDIPNLIQSRTNV